ncbi:MAG: UvrD-helicase domain-containing protein [Candidatus Aminicenantes bacterium]|nr:UvrD-helicase domain-containing protein [Candidatus Aminicenantes bacterium]
MEKSILKLEASAGSGKTYRLALEYLGRLLLTFAGSSKKAKDQRQQRESLGSILAITFTVKAAQEMKGRIVEKLKRFALSSMGQDLDRENREFLDLLARETKLAPEKIIELCGELIELILASYDDFNVTTIDSLMSAMVKAISPDLDLPADYEIAIDTRDELETRSRALLADMADNQWQRLIQTLGDFKKFDAYSGWKTDEALAEKLIKLFHLDLREGINLGGESREDRKKLFCTHSEDFKINLENLLDILSQRSEHANNRVVNSKLLESVAAFSWNEDNLFKLEKLLEKSFFIKSHPGELLKKSNVPAEFAEEVGAAFERMRSPLQALVFDISTLKTQPYREFFPDFTRAWNENKHTLFVEEFSRTLAGRFSEWGKTGIPYLYLKMSDHFLHFLFDEFQDTSILQFKALSPLIDEVLSRRERGSLFIVGDRKQAIYRWRGGNTGLMEEEALKEEIPAINNLSPGNFSETLDMNWRSREEIVKFNNMFWAAESISLITMDNDLQQAIAANFADSRQDRPKDGHRAGGYVELSLSEERQAAAGNGPKDAGDGGEGGVAVSSRQLGEITAIIGRLREHGYEYSAIAVLVRKNVQVRDIVRHLGRERIPTISDQSLMLDSNPRINEIIAFFKFMEYPPDDLNFHAFVNGMIFQAEAKKRFPEETADFSEEIFIGRPGPAYKRFQERLPAAWQGLIEPFFQAVGFLPPYDLFSDICQVFRLYENFPGDTPFFMALGDTLHAAELLQGNSIAGFLHSWDKMVKNKESPAVAIPENSPGVRVLTMHQSKGLEFAAVIIPVNESAEISPGALHWDDGKPFHITNPIAQIQDELKGILCRENIRGTIDLLNLLYVAFTRAREALFIQVAVNTRPGAPTAERSGLVKRIAKASDIVCRHPLLGWFDEKPHGPFSRGELKGAEKSQVKEIVPVAVFSKKVMTRSWQADYLVFKETRGGEQCDRRGSERGDRFHGLLSRLGTISDPRQLAARVQEMAEAEQWPVHDIVALSGFLCSEAVFPLLTFGREFSSEKELVDNSGPKPDLLRLDRLQVGPEEVLVIDFKTGKERNTDHVSQMRKYLVVVAPLFPGKKCSGRLLYIDRGEVAEVPCSS